VARAQLTVAARQLQKEPNDPRWLVDERHSKLVLIMALQRQCRFAEAEPLARQQVEITARAMQADEGNIQVLREYSTAISALGQVLLGAGQAAEAMVLFQRRLALLETVAPTSPQAALIANDLVPACDEIVNAALRCGDFAAAERAVVKALEFFKRRPNVAPERLKMVESSVACVRDAYQMFPRGLTLPEEIAKLPNESAVHAMHIRAIHLASTQQIQQADLVLQQAHERFPNHIICLKAEACVNGLAANQTNDLAECSRRITSGIASLMRAIELDNTVLETMHLAPEWNALRTSPEFLSRLAKHLLARYPID
jgi:tetratricopeptide (TPR) repeat protein